MSRWPEVALADACIRVTDGSHFSPKAVDVGRAYVTVRDLNNGEIDLQHVKRISHVDFAELEKNGCSPTPGDVLFSKDGTVGKVALVPDGEAFVALSSLAILSPRREILESKFLAYVLQSPQVLKTAIDKKSGTALRRIILRDLKAIRIPLPTLAEQKRIATKLEGALAILGSLDVLLGKKENLFSELRNAMRDQIFQRVPAEAIKTLPQISKNLDSRRVPITKSVRSEGFVPYYGASGIVDHVADAIFDEELLLVSEDGANLLTRNTPIAFSISGPAWVNNHAHVICFQERVTQKYVELYFESISVADWVTGAAQPKLNQSALNSIPIRIPESLEEQQHVVEALLQLEAILDKERVQASDLESSSRALRKSILDSAFSGEF